MKAFKYIEHELYRYMAKGFRPENMVIQSWLYYQLKQELNLPLEKEKGKEERLFGLRLYHGDGALPIYFF